MGSSPDHGLGTRKSQRMSAFLSEVKKEDANADQVGPILQNHCTGTNTTTRGRNEGSAHPGACNKKDRNAFFEELDLEHTLEGYEEFLIEALEASEKRQKDRHELSQKRVRGKHTKACTKCGYNDWLEGEIFYAGDGPPWAASLEKFCRACHREWLHGDLPDKYVTPEVKDLREAIDGITEYRKAKWSRKSGNRWVGAVKRKPKAEKKGKKKVKSCDTTSLKPAGGVQKKKKKTKGAKKKRGAKKSAKQPTKIENAQSGPGRSSRNWKRGILRSFSFVLPSKPVETTKPQSDGAAPFQVHIKKEESDLRVGQIGVGGGW